MHHRFEKIGILGGTFNPIHCGHLIIAEAIRENFCLDKILFIPSRRPPHKPDNEVIDSEHRYEMVRRSLESNPFFEASRVEIDREGFTYTVNTLQLLREKYGEETALYFIIGADVVAELTTWKEYQRVFQLCEFIAVLRPNYTQESFLDAIDQMKEAYDIKIHPTEAPLIEVSSSDIREKCKAGKSIKYLVTEAAEEYIIENGLYIGNG